MAAYGTLLSLSNTINQIQNHPRPPISLDKIQIEHLIKKVAFLQDFLENYTIDDDDEDGLEGRMVDAAHEAEDIIESHIADRIDHIRDRIRDEYEDSLYQYIQKLMMEESDEAEDITESQIAHHIEEEARGEANKDGDSLYRELQKVIHDLDSITKDVAADIKVRARKKLANATTDDVMDKLNNSPYWMGGNTNDVMMDVMSKLTDRQSSRWIIGIAGMGGIGKTTLATNIYRHPLIGEYFDMRGWSTISQEYNSKRILLDVLDCIRREESGDSEDEEELGRKLYQSLLGRRYLIVMDDIWGTDAWNGVKRFFPVNNNNQGSKVLITTRSSKVALQLDGPDYFQMPFLKVDESWNLLRRCVFGECHGCPPEFEEIGKDIATNCSGLPLSIVVIGGLLAKSGENWQFVLENLSSIVNLEEDERCLRILKLSYDQLPVHLKPCFLYMGMYREDKCIHVSTIMRLWVAEGFVKPVAGKSLETTTARVVYDLALRNLILVHGWDCNRRIKRCSIHDLLRDLCIKEAEKYKFFHPTHNYPDHGQSWCAQRRISIIQQAASERKYKFFPEAVQSASRVRTLIWNDDRILPSLTPFRLLRVLNGNNIISFWGELFHMVNLRHLFITARLPEHEFPLEFYQLWNLQTLSIFDNECDYAPVLDIWQMPQLRHVWIYKIRVTDPPPPPPVKELKNGWMVLENLETLKRVSNLRLGEEVVERIPNIKKLEIEYNDDEELSTADSDYGLGNLCRLHKLESLILYYFKLRKSELMVTFPVSLRKLTLHGTELGWEEMGTKIGSLPYLESLKLESNAFVGPEWETAEGGFRSLKYLAIHWCSDLEQWRAEATHFPRLERLRLSSLYKLKEIPLGIGDINTLTEIHVDCGVLFGLCRAFCKGDIRGTRGVPWGSGASDSS